VDEAMTRSLKPRSARYAWRQGLIAGLLLLLLAYALLSLVGGILASHGHHSADLMARAQEFAVFREGLYPMRALVPQPLPRSFPYTVYPPYALVMFLPFFAGGVPLAWALVQGLSLLSLGLIGWVGWRCLRFAGPAAGLLGALAPAAISGNSNALFHGQFSILCMGLISLQWLLLERRRPLAAGLCWAAAMLKPQIALSFGLPMLRRGKRPGLMLGLAVLLLLSLIAFAHTGVNPARFLALWLQPGRFGFVHAGNTNLMSLLGARLGAALVLAGLIALLAWRWLARRFATGRGWRPEQAQADSRSLAPSLQIQGLCAVLGAVALYHYNYDNIMLFPALLAILARALRHGDPWSQLMAVAMALSLWTPVHLTANSALPEALISATWLLVGLTLLLPPRDGPSLPEPRRPCRDLPA